MIRAASTISTARSFSKEVARTAPGASTSISPRSSSSPGPSGIGGLLERQLAGELVGLGGLVARLRGGAAARPLLGALRVVALAPTLVGAADDLALQLVEAVHDR